MSISSVISFEGCSLLLLLLILLDPSKNIIVTASTTSQSISPDIIVRNVRRVFNFGNVFGTATSSSKETPYNRIIGQPVFAVTTPWGSPYMNMEKLTDLDETISSNAGDGASTKKPQSLSEEQNEYRMVALYYMDPDDAVAVHSEMKQLDNMVGADIRLTATSFGKAIRQASNLGLGLVTGAPPDSLTGKLNPPDDGSVLRYKIVPSKRQLFYATRCIGRERVGFVSDNPVEDAQACILGSGAIDGINLARRREKRERKTPPSKNRTPLQLANQHMEGYVGIPVFYCRNIYKQQPLIKRLTSGIQYEIPLFFNYEDLIDTYNTNIRSKSSSAPLPDEPTVEVFNLWDVITSIDKYQQKHKQQQQSSASSSKKLVSVNSLFDTIKKPFVQRFVPIKNPGLELDLNAIAFIPNSRCVHYKNIITAQGNGKARLRPMRNYN